MLENIFDMISLYLPLFLGQYLIAKLNSIAITKGDKTIPKRTPNETELSGKEKNIY
jgi:hypothetical protein